MTSSDTADLKKIVEISITNIFIFPLIIADDISQFVLLADRRLYLSKTGHFPGGVKARDPAWRMAGLELTTDCVQCCLYLSCLHCPTVRLRHQQPSRDYFISHQQTSPVTQQSPSRQANCQINLIRHRSTLLFCSSSQLKKYLRNVTIHKL